MHTVRLLFLLLLLLWTTNLACLNAGQMPRSHSHTWQRYSDNPIIVPGFPVTAGGPPGLNVADADVLYDERGGEWKMWFGSGFPTGLPAPYDARIGTKYAESPDGVRWTLQDGWPLEPATADSAWDYTSSETPTVVKDLSAPPERRYLLWHSGGNKFQRTIGDGWPWYQVGLAFSADGKRFTRLPASESPYGQAGLVLMARHAFPNVPAVTDGIVADPEVVLKDGIFHLWFSSFGTNAAGQNATAGISYATSSNGIQWTPSQKNPLQSLWGNNPGGPAQPSVLWNPAKGGFEMWFTNDTEAEKWQLPADGTLGYWYAFSTNGEDWTSAFAQGRDFTWDPNSPIIWAMNLATRR
jgi:hypothetical protein